MDRIKFFLNEIVGHIKCMLDKYDFVKVRASAKENLDKILSIEDRQVNRKRYEQMKDIVVREFLKTKQILSEKDSVNIYVELSILFVIFTASLLMQESFSGFYRLFFDFGLIAFAYFAAYCFLPKREFEFKTTLLFLISTIIISPVLILTYESEISADIIKSMLTLSLIFGLAFRIEFSKKDSPNVVIFAERILNKEEINLFKNKYNVVGVINFDETAYEDFRNFSNVETAIKLIKFFKTVPLFMLPTKVVLVPSDSKNHTPHFAELADLATSLDISVCKFANGELRSLAIDDLIVHSDIPNIKSFSNKKVCIKYDGNPIVLEFIKVVAKDTSIELTVICDCEYLAKLVYTKIEREANCCVRVGDIKKFIKGNSNDIVVFPLIYQNETIAAERLRDSAKGNLLDSDSNINACIEENVKNVFVLSSIHAVRAENWLGISQRLAELYAQNADYKSKTGNRIIPIRLPIVDLFAENSEYTNKFYYTSVLARLIDNLVANQSVKGRVYSIIPQALQDNDLLRKILKITNCNDCCSKTNAIKMDSFSPLNERFEPSETDGVYFTNFVNKPKYDMSEILLIENSKSIRDLSSEILAAVYEKVK